MKQFNPKPLLPEADALTVALKQGMRDVPKATVEPEPPENQNLQASPAAILVPEDEPPLKAIPPDDVPKRFTSFRLPVSLDEELRAMVYETRRSKQDLLIEFVTAGVKLWRRERAKRAG